MPMNSSSASRAHAGGGSPSSPVESTNVITFLTLIRSIIPSFLFNLEGMGLGFIRGHIVDALRLIVVGSVIEMGRRLVQWATQRVGYSYAIRATFYEGDPAYSWINTFLQEQKVWTQSKHFDVTGCTKDIKTGISLVATDSDVHDSDDADYIPVYKSPHLFRWNSYWIEATEVTPSSMGSNSIYECPGRARLDLKIFTRNATVLPSLIAHAKHLHRLKASSHIVVHTLSSPSSDYFGSSEWPVGKYKLKRPLNSVVLPEGTMESLLGDVREFLVMGNWYRSVGIPYRRGYLLFGPPGTGKTSTVHALAGELNLEIYSLSLSSSSMNDNTLQASISAIPKRAILLIEDIDCAFSASRSHEQPQGNLGLAPPTFGITRPTEKQGSVTLSGLLNVLDGIGSDEGRIFFATTNHIDLIDPALIRPGRIDVKIQYHLACAVQIRDLFLRFYPKERLQVNTPQRICTPDDKNVTKISKASEPSQASRLLHLGGVPQVEDKASAFTSVVPINTFSVAELQGFLITFKDDPIGALGNIQGWVKAQRSHNAKREG